jgi:hypothetical protein
MRIGSKLRAFFIPGLFLCLISGCAVKVLDEDTAQGEVDSILYHVAGLRGLEVLASVPVNLKSPQDMRALLEQLLEGEMLDEDFEKEALFYYHLGLLPEGYDLKEALLDFYEDQVAALYDAQKDEMVVVTPLRSPRFAPLILIPGSRQMMKELILSHELVHALDDQHFHLEKYSAKTCDNQDHLLAVQAVAEGSAVLFSTLYIYQDLLTLKPELMEKVIRDVEDAVQKELARSSVPEAVIAPIFFSYGEGLKFVYRVYKERGIEGVNELYEDENLSTENILHPDRYLAGIDFPVEVELKSESYKDNEDEWDKLCEGTMGEFGVKLFLQHFLPKDVAQKAAEGWAGDRYVFLEGWGLRDYIFDECLKKKRVVLIWDSVWDTDADAEEFHEALLEALRVNYPGLKKIIKEFGWEIYGREDKDVEIVIAINDEVVVLFDVRFLNSLNTR